MNANTMDILCELTGDFYARCASSFSATRERPWRGWDPCLDAIAPELPSDEVSVLDVACGNLRFETYLAQRLDADVVFYAIDSCPALVPSDSPARFLDLDVIAGLRDESLLQAIEPIPPCDLVCSFGFFHHVPTQNLRFSLLDALISKTSPGGFVLISLWRFERDERLRAKAEKATERARSHHLALDLEEGDWLLGWQDSDDAFRYCHSFSDDDVAALIEHAKPDARLVGSFQADGKHYDLNDYLVFKRD